MTVPEKPESPDSEQTRRSSHCSSSAWICVADQLPGDGERVIVLLPFGMRVRDDTYTVNEGWLNTKELVSHWQPINRPGTLMEIGHMLKDKEYYEPWLERI